MKKIYQIFELLTDILFHVRSIDHKINSVSDPLSSEKQVATFLASSPAELKRVMQDISENPAPPVCLGEYYIVKVFTRSF